MIDDETVYRHVLGRVLAEARIRAGTQHALAGAAGVAQGSISRIERGLADVDVPALRRLVAAAAPGLPFPEFLARVERVYEAALEIRGRLPGGGDAQALAQLALTMAPLGKPCGHKACARLADAALRCPFDGCGAPFARCLKHGGFEGVGEDLETHVAANHRGA